MADREKLVALLESDDCPLLYVLGENMGTLADHLLANGVVVREKGEWRNNKDEYPECTRCGYMPQYDPMIDDIYYSDFCPNCGADMRKGENG
jgi:ribosomal protein S27AE